MTTETLAQFNTRLARIHALNETCTCSHPGWVHTEKGCIGHDPGSDSTTFNGGKEFRRCKCRITQDKHVAALLGRRS